MQGHTHQKYDPKELARLKSILYPKKSSHNTSCRSSSINEIPKIAIPAPHSKYDEKENQNNSQYPKTRAASVSKTQSNQTGPNNNNNSFKLQMDRLKQEVEVMLHNTRQHNSILRTNLNGDSMDNSVSHDSSINNTTRYYLQGVKKLCTQLPEEISCLQLATQNLLSSVPRQFKLAKSERSLFIQARLFVHKVRDFLSRQEQEQLKDAFSILAIFTITQRRANKMKLIAERTRIALLAKGFNRWRTELTHQFAESQKMESSERVQDLGALVEASMVSERALVISATEHIKERYCDHAQLLIYNRAQNSLHTYVENGVYSSAQPMLSSVGSERVNTYESNRDSPGAQQAYKKLELPLKDSLSKISICRRQILKVSDVEADTDYSTLDAILGKPILYNRKQNLIISATFVPLLNSTSEVVALLRMYFFNRVPPKIEAGLFQQLGSIVDSSKQLHSQLAVLKQNTSQDRNMIHFKLLHTVHTVQTVASSAEVFPTLFRQLKSTFFVQNLSISLYQQNCLRVIFSSSPCHKPDMKNLLACLKVMETTNLQSLQTSNIHVIRLGKENSIMGLVEIVQPMLELPADSLKMIAELAIQRQQILSNAEAEQEQLEAIRREQLSKQNKRRYQELTKKHLLKYLEPRNYSLLGCTKAIQNFVIDIVLVSKNKRATSSQLQKRVMSTVLAQLSHENQEYWQRVTDNIIVGAKLKWDDSIIHEVSVEEVERIFGSTDLFWEEGMSLHAFKFRLDWLNVPLLLCVTSEKGMDQDARQAISRYLALIRSLDIKPDKLTSGSKNEKSSTKNKGYIKTKEEQSVLKRFVSSQKVMNTSSWEQQLASLLNETFSRQSRIFEYIDKQVRDCLNGETHQLPTNSPLIDKLAKQSVLNLQIASPVCASDQTAFQFIHKLEQFKSSQKWREQYVQQIQLFLHSYSPKPSALLLIFVKIEQSTYFVTMNDMMILQKQSRELCLQVSKIAEVLSRRHSNQCQRLARITKIQSTYLLTNAISGVVSSRKLECLSAINNAIILKRHQQNCRHIVRSFKMFSLGDLLKIRLLAAFHAISGAARINSHLIKYYRYSLPNIKRLEDCLKKIAEAKARHCFLAVKKQSIRQKNCLLLIDALSKGWVNKTTENIRNSFRLIRAYSQPKFYDLAILDVLVFKTVHLCFRKIRYFKNTQTATNSSESLLSQLTTSSQDTTSISSLLRKITEIQGFQLVLVNKYSKNRIWWDLQKHSVQIKPTIEYDEELAKTHGYNFVFTVQHGSSIFKWLYGDTQVFSLSAKHYLETVSKVLVEQLKSLKVQFYPNFILVESLCKNHRSNILSEALLHWQKVLVTWGARKEKYMQVQKAYRLTQEISTVSEQIKKKDQEYAKKCEELQTAKNHLKDCEELLDYEENQYKKSSRMIAASRLLYQRLVMQQLRATKQRAWQHWRHITATDSRVIFQRKEQMHMLQLTVSGLTRITKFMRKYKKQCIDFGFKRLVVHCVQSRQISNSTNHAFLMLNQTSISNISGGQHNRTSKSLLSQNFTLSQEKIPMSEIAMDSVRDGSRMSDCALIRRDEYGNLVMVEDSDLADGSLLINNFDQYSKQSVECKISPILVHKQYVQMSSFQETNRKPGSDVDDSKEGLIRRVDHSVSSKRKSEISQIRHIKAPPASASNIPDHSSRQVYFSGHSRHPPTRSRHLSNHSVNNTNTSQEISMMNGLNQKNSNSCERLNKTTIEGSQEKHKSSLEYKLSAQTMKFLKKFGKPPASGSNQKKRPEA